jgi:hypothetical protein
MILSSFSLMLMMNPPVISYIFIVSAAFCFKDRSTIVPSYQTVIYVAVIINIYRDLQIWDRVDQVLHNATYLERRRISICNNAIFLNVASKVGDVADCNDFTSPASLHRGDVDLGDDA